MFFAAFTPPFGVAAAVMAVVVGLAWRRRVTRPEDVSVASERRWQVECCALLVVPCLLFLVCECCESKASGPVVLPSQVPDCGGLLPVLKVVPYVQIGIAALLVWRHRARLKRSVALAVTRLADHGIVRDPRRAIQEAASVKTQRGYKLTTEQADGLNVEPEAIVQALVGRISGYPMNEAARSRILGEVEATHLGDRAVGSARIGSMTADSEPLGWPRYC
jgi:hypothetical protein